MLNGEWRFPITNFISIGAPFGVLRFPGVQGALFVDYGRAWTRGTTSRGELGSSGLSFRMPLGAPLVLRLDLGWRFHGGNLDAYSLPLNERRTHFVDLFFGFNY